MTQTTALHYSVGELNSIIKTMLEEASFFSNISVSGEVSNLKHYALGKQTYFNLSDGTAQLSCVLYQAQLNTLPFPLKNGVSVTVQGKLKVFHRKGSYVFHVFTATLNGNGIAHQQLEKLKQKLLKEGLFDASNKVALPKYPKHIGLITSPGSAAQHDFLKITQCTAPCIDITVIPAVMQGHNCAPSVSKALLYAQENPDYDAIVLLRGGGSAEDLSAFNEEILVRLIAQCSKPIVTAIGHEIDYTLVDFASDQRAETPTAAAQLLASHYQSLSLHLRTTLQQLSQRLEHILLMKKEELKQNLDRSALLINTAITEKKSQFKVYTARLANTNPLQKLEQGFSICRIAVEGVPVRSISDVGIRTLIETRVSDGVIISEVTAVTPVKSKK